jgi:hypothetical protein
MDDKPLLNEREAAARLGLHPITLRKMRQRGVGPAWCRISAGRIAYPADRLKAYVESQMAVTTAPAIKRPSAPRKPAGVQAEAA